MSVLQINVADFGAKSEPGDRVILQAPYFRESQDGGRVVSTAPQVVELTGGAATVNNVDPGPLLVSFDCRNIRDSEPREINVPATGTHKLSALLRAEYDYSPPVLSAVGDAAARAEKAAVESAGSAAEAARILGESVTATQGYADAAKMSAAAAADSAADTVLTKNTTGQFLSDATKQANRAETWATRAKASADEAKAGAALVTGSAESAAASVAAEIMGWRDRAETAATTAQGSATTAQAAATKASAGATTVQNAVTSAKWVGDRLTILGVTSPHLTGAKGDKGEPGDVSTAQLTKALSTKADLVGGKVPTSQIPAVALTKPTQVTSRGAMMALDAQEGDVAIITTGPDKGSYMLGSGPKNVFESWMELAVSQDAPVKSVNGQTGTIVLSPRDVGAAPAAHTHKKVDITDLEPVEYAANPGSIVKRALGGHVTLPSSVGADTMAASVGYVKKNRLELETSFADGMSALSSELAGLVQGAETMATEAKAIATEAKTLAGTVPPGPWAGTRAEYDALPTKDPDRLYIITGV